MLSKSLAQREQGVEPDQKSMAGSVTKSPMNRFESKQEIREPPSQNVSIDDKKFFTKS